jgi:hypothetical protein
MKIVLKVTVRFKKPALVHNFKITNGQLCVYRSYELEGFSHEARIIGYDTNNSDWMQNFLMECIHKGTFCMEIDESTNLDMDIDSLNIHRDAKNVLVRGKKIACMDTIHGRWSIVAFHTIDIDSLSGQQTNANQQSVN